MKGTKLLTSICALALVLSLGGCHTDDDQETTGTDTTEDKETVVVPTATTPADMLQIIDETGMYSVWFEHDTYYGEAIIPEAEYATAWDEEWDDQTKFATFEQNYSDTVTLTKSTLYNIVVTFDYLLMTDYVLDEDGNYNLAEELICLNDPEAEKGYIYMHTTDGTSWLAERNKFSSSNAQGYVDDGYYTIWDSDGFYFSADDFVATGETVIGEDGLTYDVYETDAVGWFTTIGGSFVYGAYAYARDKYDISKDGVYFCEENQTLTSLFSYKEIFENIHALVEPDDPDNYEEDWDIESYELRYYDEQFTATVYNAGYEDEESTSNVYMWYYTLRNAGLILG